MKYTMELLINLPREEMVEKFDNPDNLPKWQPDLKSFELLSGQAGQKGAKSKIFYQMGKREIEMVETILVRNLPDEFSATYEAKGVWNSVENRFLEVGGEKTKWIVTSEFRFGSFLMKFVAWIFPGAFKKQSAKFMQQFKEFAEDTNS
ncbi:MAG: SRPBCC family protein [Spirochaetota bacterium]